MSTQNIPFLNTKKKIILNYSKSASMGFVPRDPRTSSKQPSVFEPLKFYCIYLYFFAKNVKYHNMTLIHMTHGCK